MDCSHAVYGPGWDPYGLPAEVTGEAAHQLPRRADLAETRAPEEQLRTVVARLSGGHELSASAGADPEPLGRVLVFRPSPARSLHVVGQSPLAEEFRRLIAAGAVPGWNLHRVPQGRTPLDVIAAPLLRRTGSMRCYKLLDRQGFAYVEEVAATPDECLLELRNSGPRLIAAVRAVISELGPTDNGTATTAAGHAGGPGRVLADTSAVLPPGAAAALQVIAAWAIAVTGARTLGDLLTLAPAAAGMPADVARCWDRLAQLSLQPLAGPAGPGGHLTRLAAQLLGETDERRRLILTSRTFAPERQTYDSLARELGISRERVRQLEESALTQLAQAARQARYAPLRWQAAAATRSRAAVPAEAADTPPWMAKLLLWLACKIADSGR